MKLRCTIDGLLLDAVFDACTASLTAFDGHEAFVVEAVEALYYELVSATRQEVLALESARYRLLSRAEDFRIFDG
jgi:hypothetical protein